MDKQKKQRILAKIQAKKKLTRNEDLWYMVEVLGNTKEEAKRIIAITDNKNMNLIID